MRTLAGFDFQVQMFSGYASLNGRPGEVGQMARYPHLDFNAACFLASSALLGLIARERTHKGQRLVASHLGSAPGLAAHPFCRVISPLARIHLQWAAPQQRQCPIKPSSPRTAPTFWLE